MWPIAWPPLARTTLSGGDHRASGQRRSARRPAGALDALRAGQPHPQLTQHTWPAFAAKLCSSYPAKAANTPRWVANSTNTTTSSPTPSMPATRHCAIHRLVGARVLCQDPAPALDRVDVVQPVLFTMMVSLAAVLESYGVVPDAVIVTPRGRSPRPTSPGCCRWMRPPGCGAAQSSAQRPVRCRHHGVGPAGCRQTAATLRPWSEALSIAAINGPRTPSSAATLPAGGVTAACDRDGIQMVIQGMKSASNVPNRTAKMSRSKYVR